MGKGGVGKSAATAYLAKSQQAQGRSVAAYSLDPSHGLVRYFLADGPPPDLAVHCLGPGRRARRWIEAYGQILAEVVAQGTYFEGPSLRRLWSAQWPGLDSWVGAAALAQAWQSEPAVDVLLADLPPGVQGRQYLRAPAILRQWWELLSSFLARRNYVRHRFGNGGDTADELDRFLARADQSVTTMEALFADPTRVTVVISEDRQSWEEARQVQQLLQSELAGPPSMDLLYIPGGHKSPAAPALTGQRWASLRELPCHRWESLGLEPFREPTFSLPELAAPAAEALLQVPSKQASKRPGLHLVTGKGGVGKTQTARKLLQSWAMEGQRGPYYWVGSDVPDGGGDRRLEAVTFIAVDGQKIRDDFQSRVRQEWERVLQTRAGAEFPFERRALQLLSTLSPPGLELLGAAFEIARCLADRQATVVFDGPATAHAISFVEALEAGSTWIGAMLDLLEAHRKVLILPRLTRELLRWRKALQTLHRDLCDPHRGGLWVVAGQSQESRRQADQLRNCLAEHQFEPVMVVGSPFARQTPPPGPGGAAPRPQRSRR